MYKNSLIFFNKVDVSSSWVIGYRKGVSNASESIGHFVVYIAITMKSIEMHAQSRVVLLFGLGVHYWYDFYIIQQDMVVNITGFQLKKVFIYQLIKVYKEI